LRRDIPGSVARKAGFSRATLRNEFGVPHAVSGYPGQLFPQLLGGVKLGWRYLAKGVFEDLNL